MEKKKDILEISKERKTHDLRAASSMILPLAKKILGRQAFIETDVLMNWREIIGEEMAAYVLPQSIDFKRGERSNGVLKVCVPSGAFALELQHREKNVLARINSYFGYAAVSSLKIIQNAALEYGDSEPCVERVQKNLVTEEEEIYIKELSSDIKNIELQQAVERLSRSVISNNKGEN